MNLKETEKAYLAGLFDGEGCVGYYKRTAKGVPYHSASLHICMVDKRAPQWIMDHVGYGKISVSEKPGNRQTVYSWQLCNKPQVYEVLKAIRPYLTIKCDQVDLLFALWEAEKAFPVRTLSDELITLRQTAADQIKLLKQPLVEGVETRRADSFL
jgi:hypothetical protein